MIFDIFWGYARLLEFLDFLLSEMVGNHLNTQHNIDSSDLASFWEVEMDAIQSLNKTISENLDFKSIVVFLYENYLLHLWCVFHIDVNL